MKTKEEIKNLLLSNCLEFQKDYPKGDLPRFAIDVRQDIESGQDIFDTFMTVLPLALAERAKVSVDTWDKESVIEKRASVSIFSRQEIKEIIEFIELNCKSGTGYSQSAKKAEKLLNSRLRVVK